MTRSITFIYVTTALLLIGCIKISNCEMSATTLAALAFEQQIAPFARENSGTEMMPLKLKPENTVLSPWQDLGDLGLRMRPNGDSNQIPQKMPDTPQRADIIKTPDCNKIPRGGGIRRWKSYLFYQGATLWNWTGMSWCFFKIIPPSVQSNLLNGFLGYVGDSAVRCWIVLFISILMEIQATTLIKMASDNSDLKQMSSAISLYVVSLFGFALALRKIEVSVAYAVWSALGTAVVSIAGVFMFGQSCDYKKVVSLIMIMLGVVGLNLQDDGH